MRENIKPLAKSFKREEVHVAHLRLSALRNRLCEEAFVSDLRARLLFPRVFRAFTCHPIDAADYTGHDKSIRRCVNAWKDARTKKRENYCQSHA